MLASAERYKTAIAPLEAGNTEKLQRLRPVSFHLKSDPKGAVQYGLIAEEVDRVYPELVIRDAAGQVQGVRYDELAPMLLKEVQKQQQKLAAQDAQITRLEQQQKALVELRRQVSVDAGNARQTAVQGSTRRAALIRFVDGVDDLSRSCNPHGRGPGARRHRTAHFGAGSADGRQRFSWFRQPAARFLVLPQEPFRRKQS